MKMKLSSLPLLLAGFFLVLAIFIFSFWWGLAVIGLMLIIAFSKKMKTSMSLTNIVGISMSLGFLAGALLHHPILSTVVDSINNVHIQLPSSISIDAVEAVGLVVALILFYKKIKALMEYIALPFFIIFFAVVAMLFGMVARGVWDWIWIG